ncbi:DtxR family transcriptional regulator, Mn-dependent transcriptional regulator [Gammaproteobacteria bacterium]
MNLETELRRDELLEMLWRLREREELTIPSLRQHDPQHVYEDWLEEFQGNGMLRMEQERIILTEKGHQRARDIVRRHRLAERLLVDVMGKQPHDTEGSACEFEHILATDLVDAICTLLGHPMTCPHGQPIPEGVCCQEGRSVVESRFIPLSRLEIGGQARIMSLDTKDPQRMHRLLTLGLLPGEDITLQQRHPALVVRIGLRQIAFEEAIGHDIKVIKKNSATLSS